MNGPIKIAGGVLVLTSLVTLSFKVNSHFAKQEDLTLVDLRLEQKIQTDDREWLQKQIWELEGRYKGQPCYEWDNQQDRDRYLELKEKMKERDKDLDLIREQMKK